MSFEYIKQSIQDKIDVYVKNTDIEFKIRYLMIQELEDLMFDIEIHYKLNGNKFILPTN